VPFCYPTQKLTIILIYLILDIYLAWGNYKNCIDERILITLLSRESWSYIQELKISLHFYFIYNFEAYNEMITYRSAVQKWDALVSTGTKLRIGRSGVRISAGQNISPLSKSPVGSCTHLASCSVGTRVICRGLGGRYVMLAAYCSLAPRLRMNTYTCNFTPFICLHGVDRDFCRRTLKGLSRYIFYLIISVK
jgi:hypothetical protein